MKLSICIATLESRKHYFENITNHLRSQILEYNQQNEVEIIFERDNKEVSVGVKRQKMIERAKGNYVVHIDDDDTVPYFYTTKILKAIEENPDCIGFKVLCHNLPGRMASVSNKYDKWESNKDGFDYVRTIHHLTPVKREIALKIGYKDIRCGEDADYSLRLKQSGLLKSEVFIDEVMYEYLYVPQNSNIKYGITK